MFGDVVSAVEVREHWAFSLSVVGFAPGAEVSDERGDGAPLLGGQI